MPDRRDFVSSLLAGAALPAGTQAGPASQTGAEAQGPAWNVTAESFGAVGDGTADDTRALQAALDAAVSQGRPLALRSARYRATQVLRARGAIHILADPGATLIKDHVGRGLDIAPAPAWTGRVMSGGASRVVLAGAGLTADQYAGAWVELGTGDTAQRRVIERHTADTVEFADPLAHVPAAGLVAAVFVPLAVVDVANLTVDSHPGRRGSTNLVISFADRVRVSHCAAAGSGVNGLSIYMARGVLVEGGEYRGNAAFGLFVYHGDNVVVSGVRCADNRGDYNLEIKDCRNAVAMGCVTSGGERGVALYASGVNPTHNCQIIGCMARDGSFAGFQATSQTNEGSAFGADGYAIRACSAWGHQTGFVVGEAGSRRMAVMVDGCTSVGARSIGFFINARFTHVRGCRAERSGDAGYRVQKDACLLDGCASVDDQYRSSTAGPAVDIRAGVQQTTVRNLLVQRTHRDARVNHALAEETGADQTLVENLRVLDSEGTLRETPALVGRRSRGPATPP